MPGLRLALQVVQSAAVVERLHTPPPWMSLSEHKGSLAYRRRRSLMHWLHLKSECHAHLALAKHAKWQSLRLLRVQSQEGSKALFRSVVNHLRGASTGARARAVGTCSGACYISRCAALLWGARQRYEQYCYWSCSQHGADAAQCLPQFADEPTRHLQSQRESSS